MADEFPGANEWRGLTLGGLLELFRAALDDRDRLNAELRDLNGRLTDLERALLWHLSKSNTDSASGCGVTVRAATKWRARYDPAKWESVLRWALDTGNVQIVQRRTSDAKIMELVDGGTPLPDGLSVESYSDLDYRRST